MFKSENFRPIILCLSISLFCQCAMTEGRARHFSWLQNVQAASEQSSPELPATKAISQKMLEKYQPISITVEEDGKKVEYKGVPLRVLFSEMFPDLKLESIKKWKDLSRQELVMEVIGDDGYPGLVSAIELGINKAGDRFVLSTHRDGKLIDAGVHLICKMDEDRARWVRQVVSLRVVSLARK